MNRSFHPPSSQPRLAAALIAAVIFVLLSASWVFGQEKELTIEQALRVGDGLTQLVKYETVDKEGKPAVGYYKFSGDVRVLIAVNLDLVRNLQTRLTTASNDLIMQWSEGAGTVPDEKKSAFAVESMKVLQQPARVSFARIKLADLKLEENPIPATILSMILPVVDR